jgi:hypothetical protein
MSGTDERHPVSGTVPDVAPVQARTVRVLVASQVLGGVGVASGIAVGGLLAEDVSGSTTLSGLASTTVVLGAGARRGATGSDLLGPRAPPRPRGRVADRGARRGGHGARRGHRRLRRPAARRARLRSGDGGESPGAVRGDRSRPEHARRPRSLDRGVGNRPSARSRVPNLTGPGERLARADRAARARRTARVLGGGVRRGRAAGGVAAPAGSADRRAAGSGRAGDVRCAAPQDQHVVADDRRVSRRPQPVCWRSRRPRGHGRRHDDDAGAHAARRRRPPTGRPGDQRAHRRHVRAVAGGRVAGRPGRQAARGPARSGCAAGGGAALRPVRTLLGRD